MANGLSSAHLRYEVVDDERLCPRCTKGPAAGTTVATIGPAENTAVIAGQSPEVRRTP